MQMSEFKICTMGKDGVGKSALMLCIMGHAFMEEYDPTIEDSYRKEFKLEGETIMLDLLDTAGMEEFDTMCDQWINSAQGIILVYDVTNKKSWDKILDLKNRINLLKKTLPPIVLVGNKLDRVSKKDPLLYEFENSLYHISKYQNLENFLTIELLDCSLSLTRDLIPMILNYCIEPTQITSTSKPREVDKADVMKLAAEWKCSVYETSVKECCLKERKPGEFRVLDHEGTTVAVILEDLLKTMYTARYIDKPIKRPSRCLIS